MSRHPLGCTPYPDESLPGFVVRLAERLGCTRTNHLSGMAGLRHPGFSVATFDLPSAASILDLDAETVRRMAYGASGRRSHVRFRDSTIGREFIDLRQRRFCPACLTTAGYHRVSWDFVLMLVCPVHSLPLTDRCPGCGQAIDWDWPRIDFCRCGIDFRSMTAVPGGRADLIAARRILSLAAGHPVSWLADDLLPIDRADLVRASMRLGMFLTGWRGYHDADRLRGAGFEASAAVVRVGVNCLARWPKPFQRHLAEAVAAAADRPGRFGARKSIGPIYDWIHEMRPGPLRDLLSSEISRFVSQDGSLAKRSYRSRVVRPSGDVDRLTLKEAAVHIGVSQHSVGKMIGAGILPPSEDHGRGIPMVLDAAKVKAVAERERASVGLIEAAARLGVGVKLVRQMVGLGILKPIHCGPRDGWGRWAFGTAEIEGLLEKFRPTAEPATLPVAFHQAVRLVGLRCLVGSVSSGVLPVRENADGGVGLAATAFDRCKLEALRGPPPEPETVAISDAAKRLGLKHEVATHLVRKRLLRVKRGRVPIAAIEAFRETYVTGAEIARRLGTSPRSAAVRLAELGVRPVVGPEVDGSRQNVFRRGEFEASGPRLSGRENLRCP